jgi:hypothetical protein
LEAPPTVCCAALHLVDRCRNSSSGCRSRSSRFAAPRALACVLAAALVAGAAGVRSSCSFNRSSAACGGPGGACSAASVCPFGDVCEVLGLSVNGACTTAVDLIARYYHSDCSRAGIYECGGPAARSAGLQCIEVAGLLQACALSTPSWPGDYCVVRCEVCVCVCVCVCMCVLLLLLLYLTCRLLRGALCCDVCVCCVVVLDWRKGVVRCCCAAISLCVVAFGRANTAQ